MRLFYYDVEPNFGDSLNQYIFWETMSDILNDRPDEYFVWIGSILGMKAMHDSTIKKHIFSSGFAYEKPPKIDSSFNILCVRWPLTAKKLWIDQSLVIADWALLTPKVFPKNEIKMYDCSFMPHHRSIQFCNLKELCLSVWINYIDPCQNPLISIDEINRSKLLITEAMHGAIVADAYRVPWIGVDMYGMNKFKWQDWMLSLGLDIPLHRLPMLFENNEIIAERINKKLEKYRVENLLRWPAKIIPHIYSSFYPKKKEKFLKLLENLSKQPGFLSQEKLLEKKQIMLEICLKKFKDNYNPLS